MNKMNKFMIACFALFLIGSVVFADDVVYDAITYPFASGTKAMAADVNAAFDEVEASVNDNNTRITGLEVSTLDGVSNVGGDIDIVGGTEITITSDDTLNTITISAPSDLAHKDGTLQTNLNADMLDTLSESSFFRLNQSEVVAGRPSFNGGTSGSTSPFNVDSNTVVTNLNADLLDGYNYSSFIRTTGGTMTGTLTVPALNYSTAKTGYLTVSGVGFTPEDSTTTWVTHLPANGGRMMTGGTLLMAAPVMGIPHGARITGISIRAYDGSATQYITIALYKGPVSGTAIATASTTAAFSGGWTTVVSSTVSHIVSYSATDPAAYYLCWTSSGTGPMYLYAAKITYTYTSP